MLKKFLIYFEFQLSSSAFLLALNFCILPVVVFGSSQNSIFFGTLKLARVSLQKLINSFSVLFIIHTVSINAQGTSPHFSSDFDTTAAMDTDGCFDKVFSISIDDIFSPPEMIISLDLS